MRQRNKLDKLLGIFPEDPKFPVLFPDFYMPSFPSIFLYALDFDFMILEVLIISLMARVAENG